jgi:hypothetical protein
MADSSYTTSSFEDGVVELTSRPRMEASAPKVRVAINPSEMLFGTRLMQPKITRQKSFHPGDGGLLAAGPSPDYTGFAVGAM